MTTPPSAGTAEFHIRLPEAIGAALRDLAAAEARTINSQIVVALREWLEGKRVKLPRRD